MAIKGIPARADQNDDGQSNCDVFALVHGAGSLSTGCAVASEIKLTGFRELSNALGELKKSTERSVLRRTATKALQPFVARAKELAPVHEGRLRDSIVIGTNLTKEAKAAARAEPKAGIRVFAGTANRNGVPREFGSVRSAAHPFMRPAWDSTKDAMLEQVKTDLATDIEKTAARAAKKAARSA